MAMRLSTTWITLSLSWISILVRGESLSTADVPRNRCRADNTHMYSREPDDQMPESPYGWTRKDNQGLGNGSSTYAIIIRS